MRRFPAAVLLLLLCLTSAARAEGPAIAERSFAEWAAGPRPLPPFAPSPGITLPNGPATLVYYTDQATFEAAFPDLLFEDFEEARLPPPPANYVTFPGPLDASTNNGVFLPGEISPGLVIAAAPTTGEIFVYGASSFFPTVSVGANTFADYTQLLFPAGVHQVGFYLGGLGGNDVPVEIYGAGGVLLGIGSNDLGVFFGVASDQPIHEVRFEFFGELVDNIFYEGQPIGPPVAEVPSLSQLGLTVFAALSALAALVLLARRR